MAGERADDPLNLLGRTFFRAVPETELGRFVDSLERRRFAPGSVVVAEGDRLHELYVAHSGRAEVVVRGADGGEVVVGQVGPGETVGEMGLLSGQPAGATVRALSEFEVLVVTSAGFAGLSERFPAVYRHLCELLARRLEHMNRLVGRPERGRLTALEDDRSPPLLGYALACSIAWHTREPTVLAVLREAVDDELAQFIASSGPDGARAVLLAVPPADVSAGAIDSLLNDFRHVLVQGAREQLASLAPDARARLGPADATARNGLLVKGWCERPARPSPERIVEVAEPDEDDLSSMRAGLLPSSSAAGRSLGWAARDLTGRKVGLALGAGSLRGWSHVGVIAALQRAGLEFDYVAGTSIGAAVAGLFALGNSPERIADILSEFSPNLFRVTIPFRGILSNRGMRRYMQSMAPDARLEELDVPLAIVAADIVRQREVVFRRGSLWQAVLTSIAIPGIYPASAMGPYVLVDGGILNPVPTNVVADMGAGVAIGVRLSAPRSAAEEVECVPAEGRPPSAVFVLLRAVEIMQSRITSDGTDADVITISPQPVVEGRKLTRFAEGRRFIADGEAAAEEALPRIAAALPWLRSA